MASPQLACFLDSSSLNFALEYYSSSNKKEYELLFCREMSVVRACWSRKIAKLHPHDATPMTIKEYLEKQNLITYKCGASRSCFVPNGNTQASLRLFTQLDPLDAFLFTALIFEMGKEFEKMRLPKNVVLSSRCNMTVPTKGIFFEPPIVATKLLKTNLKNEETYTHVVHADIKHIRMLLQHNKIQAALQKVVHTKYVEAVMNMLRQLSSIGIPSNDDATHMLLEMILHSIDVLMYFPDEWQYCRSNGRIWIFCSSELSAYNAIHALHQHCYAELGLQYVQTRIDSREKATKEYSVKLGASEKIVDIANAGMEASLVENKKHLKNIDSMLKNELASEDGMDLELISSILVIKSFMKCAVNEELVRANIDELTPIMRHIVPYYYSLNEKNLLSKEAKLAIGQELLNLIRCESLTFTKFVMLRLLCEDPESWGITQSHIRGFEQSAVPQMEQSFWRPALLHVESEFEPCPKLFDQRAGFANMDMWYRRAYLIAVLQQDAKNSQYWAKNVAETVLERLIVAFYI